MVAAEFDSQIDQGQIVLRPNHSWTWRANLYLIGTLLVISMLISAGFTLNGLWVVLPFSALEMTILTGCMYYCVRRTHTTEVLTLSRSELVFERGVRRPTQRFAFDRYFSRFFVKPPEHPWYHKTIALRCRDQELEVGSFLTDDEKDQLVGLLRQFIQRLDAPTRSPGSMPD